MNKIWFPAQRAIRTVVQVLVASAAILATVVVVAPQILTALQEVLPGPTVAWIAGAIATLAAVSAALSRVMAIPQVDAFLRRWGAGSSPADAVVIADADSGELTGLTRKQYRNLKGE